MGATLVPFRPRTLVMGGEIVLFGLVASSGDDGTFNAPSVKASLQALAAAPRIDVRLHSPGGSVPEGLAVHSLLKAAGKPVRVRIDGLAASAASLIAMAGDEIVIAEHASVMIHEPTTGGAGAGADELRSLAGDVERFKSQMVGIYAARTGKSRAAIEALMRDGRYLGGDEAVALGLADRVDRVRMTPSPSVQAQTVRAAQLSERQRCREIVQAVSSAGLPFDMSQYFVLSGLSVAEVKAGVAEILSGRRPYQSDHDPPGWSGA